MEIDPLRQALIDDSESTESVPNNIVEAAARGDCLICGNVYCRDKVTPFGKKDVPETIYNLLLKMECDKHEVSV
jgi:hypothetical protein